MKAFLRCLALVAALCVGWATNAQTLGEYSFSTGVDANKWVTITDSTNLLGTGNADSRASSLQSIGFSFPFAESVYTQFSVNSDGNLRLGSTVTGTGAYSTPFSSSNSNTNSPKINFLGCDGYFLDSIHYVYAQNMVDANNNSFLAVEFCLGTYSSSTRTQKYKWQVHLYPNGNIQVVMASTAPATAPAVANQKGLCVNSQDGWVINSENNAINFTSGSTTTWSSGTWPSPNTYYVFTRPVFTCPRPAAIAVSNITATTATVSFTPGGSETAWVGTITPGIMGMNTLTLTDTIVNLMMLTPNTEYTVSVRALCGEGDTSSARTTSFRTQCTALTALDLPYNENFESYGTGSTSQISPCWTKGTNSSTAYPYPYASAAINGARGLYFYSNKSSSATGTSYYSYAALPQLDASINVSGLTLRFYSKRYFNDADTYRSLIQVGVMTDPADITTFEPVQLVDMTPLDISTVQYNEIDFSSYLGTGKYIAFYAPVIDTEGGSATNYIYIDDVQLVTTPTCFRPTNVAASNISVISATISWTPADESQNSFVVAYGTGISPLLMSYDTVTGTTANLTGLSQATYYNVYVKALCSATDESEWSLPCSFATTMLPRPILTATPYNETFEGTTTWLLSNDHTNKWYIGNAVNNGGEKSLYISNDGGVSNAYTVSGVQWSYAIKTFTFQGNNIAFSFDWKCNGESNYDYLRAFLVPTSANITGGVSPLDVTPYSFRNVTPEGWIALDNGDKMNLNNSWLTRQDTISFDSSATYNLVFVWANDGSGGSQPPVAIDNVQITVVPDNPCATPINVTVNNITDSSAYISWTPGDSTQNRFHIRIADGSSSGFLLSNEPYVTVSGLDPNTEYSVSVIAICDTVNHITSDFSTPVVFTTENANCNPILVEVNNPFVETFESTSATLNCWDTETRDGGPLWVLNTISNNGNFSAYDGYSYYFNGSSSTGYGTLFTPVLDLTGADSATLEFQYINPDWLGDQNELTILYRNNDTASWDTLAVYNTSVTTWTAANLTIPTVSNTLQIAFDAQNNYGYCIAIDNVVVSPIVSYCEPNPTSRDGQGITNVSFGTGDEIVNNSQYPTSAPFYGDYHDMVGAVPAGNLVNLNITYATGYTYGTIIWVDWNKNFVFDSNEVVFVGQSTNTNPVVFNANFMIPSSQDTGLYRMRIAGADSYFDSYTGSIEAAANANPCFTSSWSVAHDYSLRVLPAASCADPYNLTVSNLTPNSATITWDADSTQNNFVVRYTVANSLTFDSFTVTGTTTTLTGLLPETQYLVSVKAICSATEQSYWSQELSFYTGYCQPNPTSCDGQGITNVSFGSGNEVVNNSQRPTSSPYYGNYYDMVGAVNAGGLVNLNLTFATGYTYGTIVWVDWDNSLSFDGDEVVFVGTAPSTNPNVFNAGFIVPATQDTGVFRMRIAAADSYFDNYTSSIESAASANPCFTSTYSVAHDYSIHILPPASCGNPYNVTVSNITSNSATVSWTPADSSQNNFMVRYTNDNITFDSFFVSGTTTSLTSLLSNTLYTVTVKAVCSATDQSEWATPVSFNTQCDALNVTETNPFYESFDITSSSINCWQTTGSKWLLGTSSNSGGYSAYSGTSAFANGTGSGQDVLLSPVFNITGGTSAVLNFVYLNPVWSGDQNELVISYRNSIDSAWTTLGIFDDNVTSWTPVSLVIPTISSTTQIAFQFNDNYGYCVAIDSLTLTPVSTYNVTLATNNGLLGTTNPTPGTYAYYPGDTLTITAVPATNCHFVQWNDGDTNASRLITVTGNATYTATFDYNPITVTLVNADTTMGTTTPAPGTHTFHVGDTVSAQATANAGYRFINWQISYGLITDSSTANPVSFIIPALLAGSNITVTAQFSIDQYIITAIPNDSTLGTVTGSGAYDYNAYATLTAIPAANCHFVQWNDGDTNATRTVLVTGDATYTAIFNYNPVNFLLVNTDTAQGTVSPAPGLYTYHVGDTVSALATANFGYHFKDWLINIDVLSDSNNSNPITLVVPSYLAGLDVTVTARFTPNQYTVIARSNNDSLGTASGTGLYNYNTYATLTATPASHCAFVEWNDGDTNATRNVLVTGNASYTAIFQAIPQHTVTLTVTPDNGGTVSGAGTYYEGDNVTITATPNEGYEFSGWALEGTVEPFELVIFSREPVYTFTMDSSDIRLFAVFRAIPATIELSILTNNETMGYVLVNGEQTTTYTGHIGDTITLQAVANEGHHFSLWTISGLEDSIMVDPVITYVINENSRYIIAVFQPNVGIDDNQIDNTLIYSANNIIIVRGAEQQTIRVFDIVGRLVTQRSNAAAEETIPMTDTGIYLVKIGNAPAKRVVVRR